MKSEDVFKMPVEELATKSAPHLQNIFEQAIFIKMVRELNDGLSQLRGSMESNARASDDLAKRVHRLNIILTWATVAGSLAAIMGVLLAAYQLFK